MTIGLLFQINTAAHAMPPKNDAKYPFITALLFLLIESFFTVRIWVVEVGRDWDLVGGITDDLVIVFSMKTWRSFIALGNGRL